MSTILSSSNEDYLERIKELIDEKGYARVSDIAEELQVKPASVTKMLDKLEETGYITREKYRGMNLTDKGKKIAKKIGFRHTILEEFLTYLEIPQEIINTDIDGLEHHLSDQTVNAIQKLLITLRK